MKAVLQLPLLLASSLVVSVAATAHPAPAPSVNWADELQIAEYGNGRGNHAAPRGDSGARAPAPARRQEIKPQGDLRGDIYKHLQEERQPAPSPPPNPRRKNNEQQ